MKFNSSSQSNGKNQTEGTGFGFCNEYLLDVGDYVKFYNIKSNSYENIKIPLKAPDNFLNQFKASKFEFAAAVFSLYLSRIDRTKGCLLKSVISDRCTLLKIEYLKDTAFSEYLKEIKEIYKRCSEHAIADINDKLTYYSIFDFTDHKNINTFNGEGSALTLNVYDDHLVLIYNCDLFSDIYMNHMADNIESLIDNVVESPEHHLKDINILSKSEEDLIFEFCKGKTVEIDKDTYLSHAFRENALKYPDEIAVDDGIDRITFKELEKSSNSIAHDLHENYGIGQKSRVALMLPRSYRIAELMIALNKIGAAFIPIDLYFPIKRIEHMLDISQAKHIITTKEIADSLNLKEKIICIEDLNAESDVDVDIVTRGDDLFTIMFTSGTTGLPKGVVISNRQIPRLAVSFREIFNYSKGDVIGHYLGFGFVAAFVVYAALFFGGCCRIFNETEQNDSLLLIKDLKGKHMNSLILPPGVGIPIFENEDLQLDFLVLAGSRLDELSKKKRHTKLVNFYGTTESICGIAKVYDLNDISHGKVSLGRPAANSWVYILDKDNNRMPVGVPGEICVSNDYLAQGYINSRNLTDKVFISNPYVSCEDNERLYRTGDIGFYNFNGEIEFIGREDDQLSVRGFRIESNEILGILKRFNEISDVYLDVDNDSLIVYYATDGDLDINDVNDALKEELPGYMIPSLFVELDSIPLNQNGKIDKAALNRDSKEYCEIDIADDVLRDVVDSFKEVLHHDVVLFDDDFFKLGGNSLSAMNLQMMLKEKFGVNLSANDIIELSTPAKISNHIKYNYDIYRELAVSYTFDDTCPLSQSQMNVFLDEMVNETGTGYNNPFKISLNEKYSVGEIENAVYKLFDVYPILKSRIHFEEGNLPECSFDGEIDVRKGEPEDIDSFVRPFEMDRNLSRFLIVKDNETNVLYCDFHHLIFDGTSLLILLDKLYSILNDEATEYVDDGILREISFEETLTSDYMKDAQKFMDSMLADRDECHGLMDSICGDDEHEHLDVFELDKGCLDSFLKKHGITHNQFFTSVFAYALSRFTGSPKVLFNLIEDGRGHIDLSQSVGIYARTLPILMNCANQEVASFLEYSSDLITSLMKYDLYPFNVLANEYDLNSNITFQYSHDLFYNSINMDKFGYAVDELEHDGQGDISFFIFDADDNRFGIRIIYSDKYSKDFARLFTETYCMILHEMIDAEQLSDINYISDKHIQLLDSYNQTYHELKHSSLLDGFNDNLKRYPENKLVSYNDAVYSYSQGAFIAEKIAKKLTELKIASQDCVSFLVERSELYMFCVLGILSMGGIYVPLDANLPDERIEFMVNDTKSKVVLVSDGTCERAMDLSCDCIVLNVSKILDDDAGRLSYLPVVDGNIACILYTSGTTGIPKGVKITRKSILNVCEFYCDAYSFNSDDVYGLYSAIGFDVTTFVINVVAYAGACLSVVPEDIRLDMDKLNNHFRKQNVTHAFITTQVAKLFMKSVDCSYLDVLLAIGEKLGEVESPEDYLLVDAYGPTEAFAFVTAIENNEKVDYSSVGFMNYNMKSYVLDDELRRVPIGAVGELYLSGNQIADGYLNRPEKTSIAFVDNPYDENIMYRTGDMVRILSDGTIGFIGRRDTQTKVRGNRIELGEVEAVIRQLDYVDDVSVQTVKKGDDNELIAYVVCDSKHNDSIMEHIGQTNPEYMIPSSIINLDKIPLNVNGKVDKKALLAIESEKSNSQYVPPTTDIEKIVVNAFENAFNMSKISLEDDFADLGGDSLIAIKLISNLKEYNVSSADIMSLRTPKAIAENIKIDSFDLDMYSLDDGCPLNEPQLNIYLDIMTKKGMDSYFIPFTINVSKKHSQKEIVEVLNRMFDIHPICTMKISDELDVPYLKKGRIPQISTVSGASDEFIYKFLAEPFDVHDSLCRFLITENDDEHILYSVFHHLIFDERSIHVFRKDFERIMNGESVELDESFLEASAFNVQIKNTDEYRNAHEFYNSILTDIDDVGVLLDDVLPDGPGFASCDLKFDNELFEEFIKKNSVSPYVLFTSVFAYTLSRFIGSDKVIFDIDEHGRDRFDNFDSIGMFVNTLPVFVETGDMEISQFVEKMSDLIYNILRYNYYPYRDLAIEHNISANILFQFFPDWMKKDDLFYNVDNKIVENIRDFNMDLMINVNQHSDRYTLNVQYSSKYSKNTINRFMDSYNRIVSEMIRAEKLSDINYISPYDVELLKDYNHNDSEIKYGDILEAFNDNLAKYPNNKLVSYKNISYTYGECAFIASEISKRLNAEGIEPGDFVPFLVSRNQWYLLLFLGILSAGASYVPLDDAYPDKRLKFILEDLDSKVIIACDETYERARELSCDMTIINVSDIVKNGVGTLSNLEYECDDLVSVFYTSGSTGIPKGVMGNRKAIVNLCQYYVDQYDLNPEDVYGLYTAIGFDVSIFVIAVTIYSGSCLSVIPEDIRLDMDKLNEYFINQNITHSFITTQVGKLFMQSIGKTSLDYLIVIGEKLGKVESPKNYRLVDSYGPTETFNYVTAIDNSEKIDFSSIGHVAYNMKAYVLDDELRQVPVGAVGELYLSGIQLAKGYLKREEESINAFIDNPFDGGKMYRTGDMVRMLPDKTLGIVGRRDGQVKIRGNRVELSEVESIIRDIDIVSDVTVKTIRNAGNNELVAYVVLCRDMDDNYLLNHIREYVTEHKPDYMAPSFVVKLDKIPLNVNGKVDHRALPEVDLSKLHADYVEPATEMERKIADAFEFVFNQDHIGLYDDFIRLGGDSISAIRVISFLAKEGITSTARDILDYKTPYLIAQHVDEDKVLINYESFEGIIEMLPIQKYFFNQVNENSYAQGFVLKASQDLDVNVLQNAFDELTDVHDMLRAVFRFEGNDINQEILPLNTSICKIKEHSVEDKEKISDIFNRSFKSLDVSGKLMDVNLIHCDGECYIAVVIHHLVADSISWNILLSDLTSIYLVLLEGGEIECVKHYPYKDWVEDVKSLADDISIEEKQHWIDMSSRLDDSNICGRTQHFAFEIACDYDEDNLLGLSEEEYLGLAIGRAYKNTYDEHIIFNRKTCGRDESIAEVSDTVGCFTSQYPIFVELNNDNDDVSLMKDVYNIKSAFSKVNNSGLNYLSLIYTTNELEYRHCPVTLNFLSDEFTFKNELFESENARINELKSESYGIGINIFRDDESYIVKGTYASGTYLGDDFNRFVENIKHELEFIGNHKFEDIVCCLTESQLGVYLEEEVQDLGTAYSVAGILKCSQNRTVEDIENAIHLLVDKHPILKSRILQTGDIPLLICDSYPEIEVVGSEDYSKLIRPFDLNKSLVRFFIREDGELMGYDMHHLISDATSRIIINSELNKSLNGELDDRIDLGFVYSSRDSFESKFTDDFKRSHEFFKKHLAGIDEIPVMPDDIKGIKGKVSFAIQNIREDIESFTHEIGITRSTFLNAVFAYTYSRFTGENKVFYNFTEHGRHQEYAQNAIGMFFNVIPVIVDCKDTTVKDYLISVSDLILKSMSSNAYPYHLLVKEFKLDNNIVFEYNYNLNEIFDIDEDIKFKNDDFDPVSDLFFVVNDLDDGFIVNVEHSDKFSKDTVIRFLNAFEKILIQMLEKDYLSDIDYVDKDDLMLLDSYNQTEHPLKYQDILEAFNDNLKICPENRLVSYNEASYTYGEGAFIANEIAERLIDAGIRPHDCVGFLVERSELYMFAVLGILSNGGVYVPLDDKYPDEHIQFMLNDSDSKAVIVSDGTYERANKLKGNNVTILNISDIVNGEVEILYDLPSVNADLACILYTSGTTGVPKGVKITRKAIINLSEFYVRTYDLSSNDVFGLYSSIGFDAAFKAMFASVYAGACLDVIGDADKLDMHSLNSHFISQGITHVDITTSVAKLLINQVDDIALDVLFTGGEKLGEFYENVNCRFVDGYGPTEAYVEVSTIEVNDRLDSSSIGYPVDNTKAYILDDEKRRVPIGAVGELYLAGHQIAEGYLNSKEETDNSFLPNPFDEEYGVMYKSGDMARILPDGSLGIVGRRDSQVKIRGNRVELSEVESVIRSMDEIEDVSVQTLRNNGTDELVAYVVPYEYLSNVEAIVCDYVGEHKPDYMIPSFVVCLDEIPLTVNGKVDKNALPAVNRDTLHEEYAAATTLVEQVIVSAFEKVFNQRIGVNDDFIRLGGDSLSAIKLLSFIDGYDIAVADILSLRTPSKIAKNAKNISEFDLDVYSLDSGCPLNEPQLNVYLDIFANSKFDSYHVYQFIEISKEYDIDEISDALDLMLEAHPILGMCVSDEFDVPYLIKGSKPSVSIMSHIDENYIKKSLTQAFDFHDSLCRFIIAEDDKSNYLFACFHHIIFDDLSFNVFERDFHAILDCESCDVDDSFLKVSAFNKQIQETEKFSEAYDFYESMLAGSDESGNLLDSISSDGPGIYEYDMELESSSLKYILDECGISENVLFTGVFAYTLSRFAGNENVLFNILENGRDRFGNYDAIGMYVNTLPLHLRCKNQPVSSFMKHVSNLVYGVMKYDYYPFRLLANKYDVNSNILFQYVPEWIGNRETYDNNTNYFINNTISSDLIVEILQKGDGYLLRIKYCDKYSNEFIRRFTETYKLILHSMLDANILSDIDYISQSDIKLLDEFNQTEHALQYGDILDAFNDNLSKNPDGKLVSYNDISYSYAEGAYIANIIAKSLADLGINHQDCVGFLVERSELYPFIVMGVMSMGAVYLPLDENLPDQRIRFMINDAGCRAVIGSDETMKRINELSGDSAILNVSEIVNENIGGLSQLPTVDGDLACILYTSGTTGVPKGVKITRKSILNASAFYADNYGLKSSDVYGLFSAIGFDVSNFIIAAVIYSGSCLSIVPEDIRLNMAEMNRYFIEHDVTHAFITTKVARMFTESVEDTSLDVLFVAGEKLGKVESPEDYVLVDGFGPTESFAFISSIRNNDKIHESSVGTLNYNTKAYILDSELRQVPLGAVGELCIAGHQIAEGYLNREDETNETFIENPFDDDMMYRTGDLVRFLPDGTLGFVGRSDSQVKIRGNRVELSEIEAAIREMDEIDDVTVQIIDNDLIAYVVTTDKISDLKKHIQDSLAVSKPDYMIPSFIMELDFIPLNVNGKVDKRALPQFDLESMHDDYAEPSTETERIIVEVFESAFNQKGIGLNDDFTRLGGDSIKAIRVISLLEKNNISCTARDILNYKTPYMIAQNIEKTVKKSYDAVVGEIDLLPVQSYFFDQIDTNDYTQSFVLKSKEHLDLTILQEAFDELTNLHDMLRARFRRSGDNVIQEIMPLDTRVCEIRKYSEDEIEKFIDESRYELDIENKLINIGLIHHDSESYVVLVCHHLIIDGVSWSILIDDLTYIYNRMKSNDEINLLRPYPYKSWTEDVKTLEENISQDEKEHWINVNGMLDDSDIEGKTNIFSFRVDAEYEKDNLLMISEDEYWALAISRAYKKTYGKDIIFNVESYGRDESLADVSRTIGWFTSQYPVPVKVNNEPDDISLMSDVYSIKTAFKSVEHFGLNYASLIYSSGEMSYRHCPVTFNFLSSEFIFENELFQSVNHHFFDSGDFSHEAWESTSYGITFNVSRVDDSYIINGDFAQDTYIGDKFNDLIENIKDELEFIANHESNTLVCCLSESQLGVYLDEKTHDKDTAYSVSGFVECSDKSIAEINDAIHALIDRHPILKGRVLQTDDLPLLVCDSYPAIKITKGDDYAELIKPFDLHENLARFYIVDDEKQKFIAYDMHHIISDATNHNIIKKDLFDIFDGNADDTIDLGFVYASCDSFESRFSPQYKSAEKFFRKEFSDMEDIRFLIKDIDGSEGRVTLPIHDIRSAVEAFTHKNGITVSNLLNAIFAFTYSRFTGSDRVFYNFTEHGRHENYTQEALGMFVRTIPVIADCSQKSVDEYLTRISDLIFESMKNSIYPFRLLARDFNLNNNVFFEYNYDLNDVDDTGDNIIFSDVADRVSEFSCVVNDLKDGYAVSINHSQKYSQDTAERFAKVFKEALIQILDAENLKDITYVSQKDIEILDSINHTEHSLVHGDVLDAFQDNLSRYPKNSLVIYNDKSYTYEEGAFISNEIANSLKSLGVKKDDNVSFLVERSELYMFSILGILSVGAAYVPLDDGLPDERLKFMITDTESEVLIASDDTYERAKSIAENVELLNVSEFINGDVATLSELTVDYGNLACILYTSGSTGIPKGVKITRKSLVNVCESYIETYGLNSDDVYGLFSAIGFDVTSFVISAVLCAGACLCVIPQDIRLNLSELNSHFIRQNVTHAFIPTQTAKLFMQSVEETSLDVLLVAGEKMGEFESPDNYRLVDAYGPTEAFAFVSSIDNADKTDESSVGMLNYNTKAYILDNDLRRVPCGAVGELYLSGYQIADGYLNRPEENSQAFIDNPFDDYGKLYATGDMVRLLPDGSLGFLGRRDSQVKIRGNRLELSEVESAIRQIDCIEDVSVQCIMHDGGNELVAYVAVSNDLKEDVLKDMICDYVGQDKPNYMIPSYVVRLDEIPLNVNGKVDRCALPDVDLNNLLEGCAVPKTEIEMIIVNAFESVFNQKGIGLNDDFIRFGGDSIKAIRIISLLEKNNISCTARDILNYKTPYLIAENIEATESVSYDEVEGSVDLLPIQKHFFSQISDNEFSQYFILKSSQKINAGILQASLDKLTNIHDMLRAKYRIENSNIIQEIQPLDMRVCTIKEFNVFENPKENIENIISESVSSLSLDNLMDVSIIHYDDETFVVFVIHHLIIDGVSWSILLDDLTYILTQLESGNEIDIKRPYPYKKWVDDVKKLSANISKEEKQHWMDVNSLIDDTELEGKTSGYSFRIGASYNSDNSLMLSEEEYLALAISRAYKKTYGEDIIINRESYGRDESLADVSRTVGWFTSQYPIHVNVNAGNDEISLTKDAYNIKSSFMGVNHLGLNYGSLIYYTQELKFKHCPVTFNFLSTEFSYENELFKSLNHDFIKTDSLNSDLISHGITINVLREDDSYAVAGTYTYDNHIGAKFEEFTKSIKEELDFIGNYNPDTVACVLSEVQLGVYLDEKIYDKGTAYSVPGMVECELDKSVEDVMNAINSLIDRHPILKGRIMDSEDMPLLVCDSYPSIEVVREYDSSLIGPFDLNESLARFFIIENEDRIKILYDIHHIITDATSRKLINNELLEDIKDDNPDLGFLKESNDSFNLKYTDIYRKAHEFFKDNLSRISEVDVLTGDGGGENNYIQLPVLGIRKQSEKLCREYEITTGSLFNAVFAYAYSHFIQRDKVYFNYYEHGRHDISSQDALGMFVRTVPLVVDCKYKSVKEYLKNIFDLTLDSMKYSIYPYRLLAKEFNLINDVSFEYNSDLNDVSGIGSELRIVNQEFGLFSDFICVVNDLDDGYLVSVGSSDNYSDEFVIRFLNVFREVLEAIIYKNDLSQISCPPLSGLKLKTIRKTGMTYKRPELVKAGNDIEKEVVKAFENVFDKEIGIYDDFIQLGGDSLDAVKIKFLLKGKVDAGIILKEKTPYRIAQCITKKGL